MCRAQVLGWVKSLFPRVLLCKQPHLQSLSRLCLEGSLQDQAGPLGHGCGFPYPITPTGCPRGGGYGVGLSQAGLGGGNKIIGVWGWAAGHHRNAPWRVKGLPSLSGDTQDLWHMPSCLGRGSTSSSASSSRSHTDTCTYRHMHHAQRHADTQTHAHRYTHI